MSNHPNKTENPLLKECLFTALIMLMDQKDFKDIKISEIAQKAGVSRMTYYRTYDSKEDILIQYFEDQSQEMIREIKKQPDITELQFFTTLFSYFKQHAHVMEYLFKADLLREVNSRFIDFVTHLYEHSDEHICDESCKNYEIRFIAGGLFMILLHWIETGMIETPEEMAQITIHMLRVSPSGPNKKTTDPS